MRLIPLTRGQHVAVDDADYEWLMQWKWHAQYDPTVDGFYATRTARENGRRRVVIMHREILGLKPGDGLHGDHINRNTLDNRRDNLRAATHAQSAKNHGRQRNNTSGFKGVSWNAAAKAWMARVSIDGTRKYLGIFSDPAAAYEAYVAAATELHGEFACL